MPTVTTARLLADKALAEPCGQRCVDWAITMLEQGHSGYNLGMLAGAMAPYNHFELADLRDRALRELGIGELSGVAALQVYARERLHAALKGEEDLIEVLGALKDLCIAYDYVRELNDFYLLYFAYTDLQSADLQWYWPGANRANILSVIRERARQFVYEAHPNA